MSGKSIARTLDNAFKTVGNVMGYKFKVYRPLDWVQPISDENFVQELKVAASVDESFGKPDPDELAKFILYAKSAKIEQGDIFVSEELDRTYVAILKNELRPAVGVLAQDRIKVLRPGLAAGAMVFEEIAREVPAAVKIAGSGSGAGALAGVSSSQASGHNGLEIWTWLPVGFVRLNDTVELNGVRYLITFAQNTAQGTHIKAKSSKVGQ